jgi:TRAP-type C4-dicarboxylate transport system permease small subunit
MLTRISAALDRAVAALMACLLVLTVLAVTWQVVSRYLLNDPSGWTEELARFLLVWIGLFGGAFAYHRRLHLGLDLLADRLRSSGSRYRNLHARIIDACVLIFAVAILIGGGGSLVALTLDLEQFSPALGLPMAFVYLALPLSGLLMAVFSLTALIEGPVNSVAERSFSE